MAVLFGIANINSAAGMAGLSTALAQYGFGPVNAYALMVFCLLYTPCVAAVASIKRELGVKWAMIIVAGQCVIAWICAFAVTIIGSIMGM